MGYKPDEKEYDGGTGYKIKENGVWNGSIHYTDYSKERNERRSYDVDKKGNVSKDHTTDQKTNKHTNH